MLTYSNIVKHSCDFVAVSIFNLHFFIKVFFRTLIVNCAVSFQDVMARYVKLAGYIENRRAMLPEMPTLNFSSHPAHVITKPLHERQILGFFKFIQACCIKSCARVTDFVLT